MKYEFEKVDEDSTKLKYKDKEFVLTKDVRLIKEMQEINSKARKKMIYDLAKEGLTIKNLTIETKKDGKTYFDNTNANELEQTYIQEATLELFGEIAKRFTNMDLTELILDIGLNDEKEVAKFAEEFAGAIVGKTTPS